MNLFTARLTGKLISTEKFESNMYELQQRVIRYRQVEKSPEMKEYLELKQIVESSEFQDHKREWTSRKYKDTEEGRKTASQKRLSSTLRMRAYHRALELPVFQAFLQFRETEDFNKISSFKERMKSSELRMYNMIYRSAFYRNYLKVLNSDELQQLNALNEELASEDFQQRDAFWSDKHRWEHSDEYKQEQRFLELANSDDIKFYFAQREEEIDWAELFRPTFEDKMLSGANWKAGFGYPSSELRDGHSRTSEHQAYNGGRNTFFAEGRMDIETREEPKKALAWDATRGFIDQVFSYTSDVMNTKAAFAQEQGMFMAKVRSQGSGHHFFGLTTGKHDKPAVAMYYYNGKVHQLGIVGGGQTQLAQLSGVLRSMYFVYTFRWTSKELIWYVNNLEIMRLPNNLSPEEMFFMAQSFLPVQERPGTGKLKVQWARCFRTVEDSPLAQRNAERAKAAEEAAKAEVKEAKEPKAEAKPAAKAAPKTKATATKTKKSK